MREIRPDAVLRKPTVQVESIAAGVRALALLLLRL